MSKKEFLSHLSRQLQNVPANEREDILQDYKEYFTLGEAEGKTESQIAESLGSPKLIARELLTAYQVDKMDATSSAINIFRAVWSLIGLSFVNLIIVLSPFLGLLALLVAGWMIGVVGIVSPLLVIASAVANPGTFRWFDVFASIAFCGLGFFICVGMYYATLSTKRGFIRYLKYNMAIMKGGNKHD